MEALGLYQCPIFKETGDFWVTSPYGERIHPVTGKVSFHSGIDGVREDHDIATIVAIDEGKIIDFDNTVKWHDDYKTKGNYVKILHESGRISLYLHLAYGTIPDSIKTGGKISKGSTLGVMGETGSATGIHIHFQVYDTDGKTVIDPKPFLLGKNINDITEAENMWILVEECKYGDRGTAVYNLQVKLCQESEELQAEVMSHSADKYGKLDGVFGKGLQKTLRDFQERAGLNPTGACDAETCELLNSTHSDLSSRIITALNVLGG